MMRARKAKDRSDLSKAKGRSDEELRSIALGVHEGRIITNAQTNEHRWRLYALTRRPLVIEFKQLTSAETARLRKFTEEIEAWKKGARILPRPARRSHLKS